MRRLRALGFACAVSAVVAATASSAEDASLSGRLSVPLGRLRLADIGHAVVYLEPVDAPAPAPLTETSELRQHAARFRPDFLVVAVGEKVLMPNDDTIFHNVFSYSRPNDFDLGLYRSGESRALQFDHAGPVRLYCSIHERMNGLIFVTPTRLFALPSATGEFRIEGVPPGRYRVRVWSERLPELARDLSIAAGEQARVALAFGESAR
jgi:plastocyanin